MAATIDIPAGGYRYIPFAFQYSGAVAALPGHRIERFLGEQEVPRVTSCACELRSPTSSTDTMPIR
jgi:hypothetical protein